MSDQSHLRSKSSDVDWHRVRHRRSAPRSAPASFENRRILVVLARHHRTVNRDLKTVSVIRVDKCSENWIGVEARKTEPVHRSAAGDEPGGARIADEGIFANWGLLRFIAIAQRRQPALRAPGNRGSRSCWRNGPLSCNSWRSSVSNS